eukprot:TRINITY_DN15584_c0_g1_i1.p1 TRINITY_DN15584_c0_g1~~TRINITY_DN15584_c0_g1_i1.p1  ORF type:complete len:591 (+),score=312.50 TRINITY_DN15584_c0_g1_i1:43-1773(+)
MSSNNRGVRVAACLAVLFLLSQVVSAIDFQVFPLLRAESSTWLSGSSVSAFSFPLSSSVDLVDIQRKAVLLSHTDLIARNVEFEAKKNALLEERQSLLSETESGDGQKVVTAEVALNATEITELFKTTISKGAGALVVVLPSFQNAPPSKIEKEQFLSVEKNLVGFQPPISILFIDSTPELEEIHLTALRNPPSAVPHSLVPTEFFQWIISDYYQATVSAAEPKPLKPIQAQTFQVLLPGSRGLSADAETIAIFANYDSFSISTGRSKGLSAGGSAMIGLLESLRLFSQLYNTPRSQSPFNLLFVLTAGSRELHWKGIQDWIEKNEETLLPSIKLALILDDISSLEKLTLHTSRPAKDPFVKLSYKSFENVAKALGVKEFSLNQKKVSLADGSEKWAHEFFAKEKIFSFTLSSQPEVPILSSSVIYQTSNASQLFTTVQYVAESIASIAYYDNSTGTSPEPEILNIFSSGNLRLNRVFVESMSKLVSTEVRFLPLLKENFFEFIRQTMSTFAPTEEVFQSSFVVQRDDITFFGQPASFNLQVVVVKPLLFNVFLALFVIAYLSLIYYALTVLRISL